MFLDMSLSFCPYHFGYRMLDVHSASLEFLAQLHTLDNDCNGHKHSESEWFCQGFHSFHWSYCSIWCWYIYMMSFEYETLNIVVLLVVLSWEAMELLGLQPGQHKRTVVDWAWKLYLFLAPAPVSCFLICQDESITLFCCQYYRTESHNQHITSISFYSFSHYVE